MQNGLHCSKDRQLVEKWSQLQVNANTMEHLHNCMVDGVRVCAIVSQDHAVGSHNLVVGESIVWVRWVRNVKGLDYTSTIFWSPQLHSFEVCSDSKSG